MSRLGAALTMIAIGAAGCGKVKSEGNPDAAENGPDAADTTAPVVTITQKPDAVSPPTATFAWVVDDVSATFQCSLDGGSFASCTSPKTFNTLAVGSHMFQVLARDPVGNTGMASFSWMVEPPCTPSLIELESLSPTPTGWSIFSGSVLHNGQGLGTSVVGSTFNVSFTGKGLVLHVETGPNIHTMNVSIDAGTPVLVDAVAPAFAFQVPFPIASGLPNTPHVATVTCTQTNCQPDYVDVTCQ